MTTLAECTSPTESALAQVVDVFDSELRCDLPFVNGLVQEVRTYRGKLFRPRLLLLTARALGDIRREHVTLAAVVEMVHMATLVHDDVLDEAEVRRHRTAVNRLVGNEGAVLLGDYLISHAYHLCSSLGSAYASRRIAAATNTVCEGELMQIHHRGNATLSEAEYLEIIRRKTAALTAVCCELGACVDGSQRALAERLSAFGTDLGMAFQIVDDLLDLTASEREMGKTLGRDADLGKWTLPLIRFRDRAAARDRARLLEVMSENGDRHGAEVRRILEGSDAADYAMQVAGRFVHSAAARLSALPDGEGKEGLLAAAEFIVQRRC